MKNFCQLSRDKIYIDSSKTANSVITRVVFSPSLLQIITLHQYSDHISFYYPDCLSNFQIRPKSPSLRNTIILDIYWSEIQQRLGATFKDQWICFWEAADNFDYEKVFSVSSASHFISDQVKIFYLEQMNKWITVDQESRIHFWNLEIEQISHTIENAELSSGILEIVEIPYLKLTMMATVQGLTLWDMTTPKMMFKIAVHHNRLHQVIFFQTYQMIITCGFDNHINLYQLHKKYNDGDLVGKLEGHTSLVTSIQCIEGSPIIITSDDKHIIKLWDIRILKCIQTFDLELRQPIGRIITLEGVQAICLVTSRLLVIEFENSIYDMKHYKRIKLNYKNPEDFLRKNTSDQNNYQPIKVEYDVAKYLLIVCTKKDVRIINLYNGRITKIIRGIITSHDDEITSFKTLQQHKKLVIGTQKGMIKIYECENGELIQEFQAHTGEISSIIIDYQNQILTSASFDSSISIWKETSSIEQSVSFKQREFKFQKIRFIQNAHFNSSIILMEISIYHNIIVTTTNSPTILIWNFEFGKLSATFTLPTDCEPTALSIINGFCLLIVGDNKLCFKCNIYILLLEQNQESVTITLKATINPLIKLISVRKFDFLTSEQSANSPKKGGTLQINSQQSPKKQQIEEIPSYLKYYTKIVTDVIKDKEIQAFILCASNEGSLELFDISQLLNTDTQIEFQEHCNTRVNYNPFRQSKEDFVSAINTHKINHWFLAHNQVIKDQVYNQNDQIVSQKFQYISQKLNKLTPTLESPKLIKLSNHPKIEIKAHKDLLTFLNFISYEGENLLQSFDKNKKIISCSYDQYIKIWSYPKLEQQCCLNINHPLPIKWNVQVDQKEILKFKIAFALKIVHFIRKNQQNLLTVSQARTLEPFNMFKSIIQQINEEKEKQKKISEQNKEKIPLKKQLKNLKKSMQSIKIIQEEVQQHKEEEKEDLNRVQLLREEYAPRDIYYRKIKSFYKSELQGLTLKQLEEYKKAYNYAQMWKKQQLDQQRVLEQLNQKNLYLQDEKQKELKQVMQFLNPKFRQRVLQDEIMQMDNNPQLTQILEQKLDKINNTKSGSQKDLSVQEDEVERNSHKKVTIKFMQKSASQQTIGEQQSKNVSLSSSPKNFEKKTNKLVDKSKQSLDSSRQQLPLIGENSQSLNQIHLNQIMKKGEFKTFSSRFKQTQGTNFFQYANERKLASNNSQNATSLRNSLKSTQWEFFSGTQSQRDSTEKYNQKVKIINENLGALISDFDRKQKKKVEDIISVNLMRKTSGNLFNKIVTNLENKLKKSKYSNQINQSCQQIDEKSSAKAEDKSQIRIDGKSKISFSQDHQNSTQISVLTHKKETVNKEILEAQIFDEKLDKIIVNVRQNIAKSLYQNN